MKFVLWKLNWKNWKILILIFFGYLKIDGGYEIENHTKIMKFPLLL